MVISQADVCWADLSLPHWIRSGLSQASCRCPGELSGPQSNRYLSKLDDYRNQS